MQRIIEQEQVKPLQVSKDFVRVYREEEVRAQEMLDLGVQCHLKAIRELRGRIDAREEQRARREGCPARVCVQA